MIETLARALAKLIFLKDAKNYPEALKELNSVTKKLLGIDRTFINNLSNEQLFNIIDPDKKLIAPKSYLLGVVLKEESEIYELQGDEDTSVKLYQRSLYMFLTGIEFSNKIIEEDHLKKIETIIDKLKDYEIPQDLQVKLFRFYEFTRKYDKAEDMLYELIEKDSKFTSEGIQFYERLLDKSEEELIKGNLPNAEVEEGLINLKEKLNSTS
jgi:tetratricopeptide (TPR) repeat protein